LTMASPTLAFPASSFCATCQTASHAPRSFQPVASHCPCTGSCAFHATYVSMVLFPQNANLTARRTVQPRQHAQQCRLPCPVVAQDCVQFSGFKLSGHPAQRSKTSKLFDKIVYGNDRFSWQRGIRQSGDERICSSNGILNEIQSRF